MPQNLHIAAILTLMDRPATNTTMCLDRRPALAFTALALGVVVGWVAVDPWSGRWPTCPWLAATGWLCPGCGATRAGYELVRGHLAAALRYNLLLLPAVVGLGAALIAAWRSRRPAWSRNTWFGVAAAVLAFAVLRNVPAWPFTLLAPPH